MTGTVDLAQHSCGLFLYLGGCWGWEVSDSGASRQPSECATLYEKTLEYAVEQEAPEWAAIQ